VKIDFNLTTHFENVRLDNDFILKYFSLMQINIGCIRNKLLELEVFCNSEGIDLMCVSEHWLTEDQINLFFPKNFVAADVRCRQIKKNGGTGIFIKNSLQYSVFDLSKYFIEQSFEVSCIKLIRPNENIFIISIYRSPSGDLNLFLQNFELAVREVLKFNTRIVVAGDFNIEMAKVIDNASYSFANLLRSLNLFCSNKQPTRIKSCIDNIMLNFSDHLYKVNLIEHNFADHEPLLIRCFDQHCKELNGDYNCDNKPSFSYVRKQTDIVVQRFLECLRMENLGK
jgi:exonuclease III